MSNYINVIAIVEGKTEQIFIERILAPYLGHKNIGLQAALISKPGQKGGDVRFARAQKDLKVYLKQRKDTYLTTFVDYYGIKEWPGIDLVLPQATPAAIAKTINEKTSIEVDALFPDYETKRRFIPFIAVHEFEALLFSDVEILASELGISESKIEAVISKCGSPEAINHSPQTAPSKRLEAWSFGAFSKTVSGISIAEKIGVEKMREKCPLFDQWLCTFEEIQREQA